MFVPLFKKHKALFGLIFGLFLATIASGFAVAASGLLSAFGFSFLGAAASTLGIGILLSVLIVTLYIVARRDQITVNLQEDSKPRPLPNPDTIEQNNNTILSQTTAKTPSPSKNQSEETLKKNVQNICQAKEMPNKTFLIWFGPKLPEALEVKTNNGSTKTKNYWENVVNHKNKNPNEHIHLIVSKKLMGDEFNVLKTKCEKEEIILIDFDENYKNCLNRDLVEHFLENPRDYVCASDVLRLGLLFDQGGRYFDVDLEILRSYYETEKRIRAYGPKAFLPTQEKQTYGFSIFSNHNQNAIEFHALQTCQKHPFFLLFLAASRYYSLKLINAYKENKIPNPCSKMLRERLVMYTTGAAITYFNVKECDLFSIFEEIKIWNFEQKFFNERDNHDHSWLNSELTGHTFNTTNTKEEQEEAEKTINSLLFNDIDKEIGGKENRLSFMYKKAIEYFGEEICEELTQVLGPVLNQDTSVKKIPTNTL